MARSGYLNLSFPSRYTIVHATPAMCTRRDLGENPLVRERITLPRLSRSPHLMTQVATNVGLCPHFGLHGFSWAHPGTSIIVTH